jgi:two-component system, cell cycle sensor histidine kinase and response regulator CckA
MAAVSEGSGGAETGRVLIVEDHDDLRRLFARALRTEGYIVDEASTGWEALEALDRACPDLLLADLVLPGPNGQELASLCRERCPRAVLVFMSGYSAEQLHDLDITQVVFLPKPLSPGDVVRTVTQLLAGR